MGRGVTDLARLASILGCPEEQAIAFSSRVQNELSPVPSYADIARALAGVRKKDRRPEKVVSVIKKQRTQSSAGPEVKRRRRKAAAGLEVTIDESGFLVPLGMIGEYVPREPPRSSLGKPLAPVSRGTEFAELRSRFAAQRAAQALKGSQARAKATGSGGTRKKGAARKVVTTDCHVCGVKLAWDQLKEHLRKAHGVELGGTGDHEA